MDYTPLDLGIDIYHRDRLIDWSFARSKYRVAFIKVSEYQKDPLFDEQWPAARGHILRSGYHFFRPQMDPKNAAQKFVSYFQGDYGEVEPAFDMEAFDGVTDLLERAKIFLDEVYRLTALKCMIYTSRDVLFSAGAGKKTLWGSWKYGWLKEHRLWLADPALDYWLSEDEFQETVARIVNGETDLIPWPSVPPPFDRISFLQWTWQLPPELVPGYYLGEYHKLAVDGDVAAAGELPFIIPPVDPPVQKHIQSTVMTTIQRS